MVTLLADTFDSESESQTKTYSSDDRCHCYPMPFPRRDALRVFYHADNTFACLLCPGRRQRWKILNDVKDHVVGMATYVPLRGKNKKNWSRHRVMVRNEGWMG
ncbi:hypothetical protein SETIT_3G301700v2 [Setaria italica]|uniref:Uncharacterized protein n=2 Tax=Setaria italica TaxID=4555 RepID=A0A368QKE9_SETIT|nr:hypothetical protein SETIT_3G301700v2 [Setaria italica]